MRRSPLKALAALGVSAILGLGLCSVFTASAVLAQSQHRSLLRVGANEPPRQIKLGLNKSMIVELPRPVRDVIVSNPDQIDAVMQSSTRAYLIGKKSGEANILFVDATEIKSPPSR
ncbi:pilus assembly protein N-terminal domain-containing protein [Methyloceanibacter superfactus]|uniref:pilus assembly protein N-terminal domain-containing protein n=1 Tax=Methyloceanibacter superfactus TaxID=1774969 RepID=UPI00114C88AE|nr:pilus assembly protein N-terminal domain-containing protein [Methyloceanibacter superfactus]